MDILKIEPAAHESAYGILCQSLGLGGGGPMPFGATHCEVPPGGATTPHRHDEREVFWITAGAGAMREGDTSRDVGPGDVVLLTPGREHQLTNTSSTEPLRFLSLYWHGADDPPPRPRVALVTAAPPTPNGPLHLGHASGPYVAADVHARYLRLRGVHASYLCGSDDFQSYVATKAVAAGRTPEEVTELFGDRNHATLEALGCDVAHFLRPVRDEAYQADVQAFFARLVERDALELRDAEHLHCPGCDRYLHEARVTGACPRCGAGASGNGCEGCAFVNDCVDLGDPRCATCGAEPERRRSQRYYLDLAAHAPAIEAWLAGTHLSPRVRALAEQELSRGLPAICVSHCDTWGIPVPGEAGEGQVIYEWLEMAAGYRHAAARLAGDGPAAFASDAAVVRQFFGFDNAFFYTFFIPAALLAHDPEVRLPDALSTNEFYRLEGLKFSTSRDHAVWCDDALAQVPADLLRFHLGKDRPEFQETSFSMDDLTRTASGELAELEAWATDVHQRLADGAPEPGPEPDTARRARLRLGALARQVGDAYEARDFSLRRVTRAWSTLVQEAQDLGHAGALGGESPGSLALEAGALALAARVIAPLMPATSATLLEALGLDAATTWPEELTYLPPGTSPGAAPSLGFAAAGAALASSQ